MLRVVRMGATFYTYVDEPGTTTERNYPISYMTLLDPRDGATFYTYVDEPGTTTKETTSYAYIHWESWICRDK